MLAPPRKVLEYLSVRTSNASPTLCIYISHLHTPPAISRKHASGCKYTPIGRNDASLLLTDLLNFPDSTWSEQKRRLRLAICLPSHIKCQLTPSSWAGICKITKKSLSFQAFMPLNIFFYTIHHASPSTVFVSPPTNLK